MIDSIKNEKGVNERLIIQDGRDSLTSGEVINDTFYQFKEDGHFGNPFGLKKGTGNDIQTIKAILKRERKKYEDFLECEKNELKKKILQLSIKEIDEIKVYKLYAENNQIKRVEIEL